MKEERRKEARKMKEGEFERTKRICFFLFRLWGGKKVEGGRNESKEERKEGGRWVRGRKEGMQMETRETSQEKVKEKRGRGKPSTRTNRFNVGRQCDDC